MTVQYTSMNIITALCGDTWVFVSVSPCEDGTVYITYCSQWHGLPSSCL